MKDGIAYYRTLSQKVSDEFGTLKDKFHEGLNTAEKQLEESLNQFEDKTLVTP